PQSKNRNHKPSIIFAISTFGLGHIYLESKLNQELFLYINAFAGKNAYLDAIGIGFGEYFPYLLITLMVYLYFVIKNHNEVMVAFLSTVFALSINYIIGLMYFHNRPFMDNIGITLKTHTADSSFPSDHTTFVFAIISALLLFKSTRKIAAILLPFGVISSFARVFEGIHYPLDIVSGLVVGFVSAVIVYNLRHRINHAFTKLEKKIH
ncbi:MAG: undecaprenyl-diphosphatase, partial [Gammaproteobacteria bacterium]|nr:undecaprenyl-diphosphatase [Gammaproteobacteria bacterium]